MTDRDVARAICADHAHHADALIEILREIQNRLGFIPPDAIPDIAEALNLSRAEIYGVISCYHDFRASPPGRLTVKLCRAEACQAVGAEAIAAYAEERLGVRCGATREDGAVTLEAVYCLGNCALGPAALVGEELRARLDEAAIDALAAGLHGDSG